MATNPAEVLALPKPAWAADEPEATSGRELGAETSPEPSVARTPGPDVEPGSAATAAREAIQQTRAKGAEAPRSDALAEADAVASRDDLDADPDGLDGEELLARELGAAMIEEIKHS